MEIFADVKLSQVVSTIVYALLGFALFILFLFLMERFSSFSIRKEIVDEHNISLAIVMGGFFISLGLILAAVVD
jgi:uncharacterized membrane protein YjfL (UPF0719 family)